MNNPHHEKNFNDRPGLRCRLVRRWEAWRGPATGHTALTARHRESCGDCQAFFAEDFTFEEMLRGAARAETRAGATSTMPDGGFEQRILRAVRASQPEMARESVLSGQRRRAVSPAWSLAGAAAGVALALVIAQRGGPEKSAPEVVTIEPVAGGAGSSEGLGQTPLRWWRSLDTRESALELAAQNPLQQEIESISTDAQSVLGFLALNFLPTETATTKSSPGESRRSDAGQG